MKDDKVVHLGRKKNAFEDELLEIAQLLSQDNEDAADIDGVIRQSHQSTSMVQPM